MAIRYWFRDPDGTLTEIVGRIDSLSGDFTENAEEGSVGGSQVTIRDPAMDFTIGGHRIFAVQEDSIVGDDDFIYVGYTASREIERDEDGRGRNWIVNLVDINSVLPRKLLTQASANRGAETDVERVTWWESTEDGSIIDDDRYILAAGAVAMDASADYRQQYGFDLLRDCAEHTGKNFYVTYFGDIDMGAANPWGAFSLWYGDPAEEDYESTYLLTNVAADVDSTHLMVVSAKSTLDPHRVFSGIGLPYKNGFVFVSRESTATAFALGGRDAVMPAVNVSTKAKALVRANRFADDAATEDERITVVYRVPREEVNGIRPGMRVPVRFLHIDSVADDYTWCRVLNRRITEPNLAQYEVTVELSPPSAPVTGAGADTYGIIRLSKGPFDGLVYWQAPGDTPPSGYQTQPTEGLIEPLTDGSPPNANWPLYGWKINGTGTVDVTAFLTAVGVLGAGTVTFGIALNGVVVESESVVVSGFLEFWSHEFRIDLAALDVVPDDELTVLLSCTPAGGIHMFLTPAGAGQQGERFEITGGTLV